MKGAAFVPDDLLAELRPTCVRRLRARPAGALAPRRPASLHRQRGAARVRCRPAHAALEAGGRVRAGSGVASTRARSSRRWSSIVRLLRRSIDQGIAGTHYEDRVLGHQSGGFLAAMEAGRLLDGGALNRIVLYVTALMEVKSAMGVIVAAPTAGACARAARGGDRHGRGHGALGGGHGAGDARGRPDRRVHRHAVDLRRRGGWLPGRGRRRGLHGGGRPGRRSPMAPATRRSRPPRWRCKACSA